MTLANYQPFVERMIDRYEGFYGWNAHDPGGPTKWGITCWDLAEHRHQTMDSMTRWAPLVKTMTMQEAEDIYANKYATATAFADLNPGCDCVVFDFGVNSGTSRAIRYAQRIAGVETDGIMGPKSIAAINGMHSAAFINALCDDRLEFMHSLRTWIHFGHGWSTRVADLRGYALALLHPSKLKAPMYEDKDFRIPLAYPKAWETQ